MAELLSAADVVDRDEYERIRSDFRRNIMQQKRSRRVLLGTNCSAHFENRDIMRYQVLEMLRCEGTWDDPSAVADELEAYNPLITQPDALSLTLMFEYPTEVERQSQLPRLVGIDRHVWLKVGDEPPIAGQFDAGQIDEQKVSSVQFVKFPIDQHTRERLARDGTVVRLVIDHPHYQTQAVLGEETRRSIAADLSA